MPFEVLRRSFSSAALAFDYFVVPWDTEIVEAPVAQIEGLTVRDPAAAGDAFGEFRGWAAGEGITLCCCRTPQEARAEALFLESEGFRWIELNFRPRLEPLVAETRVDADLIVELAAPEDRVELARIAGSVYEHGRFHQDPRLGPELGNRRYRIWLENAFDLDHQEVWRCVRAGEIVAFFVVERPAADVAFWSLVALAPTMRGRGQAKPVWRTMIEHHRREGVKRLQTSISSHNTAVLNLYVSLGWRFPPPDVTWHWMSAGPPDLAR